MSDFVYYIPGGMAVNSRDLDNYGLSDRLPRFAFRAPVAGPDGGNGAVVAPDATSARYAPDKQRWYEADGYWFGYVTDDPPHSGTLERDDMIAGHRVRLADGNDWLIPVARAFPAGTALPERLILGEGGEVVTERLPQYARLYEGAERAWHELMAQAAADDADAENAEPWTLAEQMDLAAEALAVNYRVTRLEVAALGVLTTRNVGEVCAALIDLPTIKEAAKKNARDAAPNTSDGGAA